MLHRVLLGHRRGLERLLGGVAVIQGSWGSQEASGARLRRGCESACNVQKVMCIFVQILGEEGGPCDSGAVATGCWMGRWVSA